MFSRSVGETAPYIALWPLLHTQYFLPTFLFIVTIIQLEKLGTCEFEECKKKKINLDNLLVPPKSNVGNVRIFALSFYSVKEANMHKI